MFTIIGILLLLLIVIFSVLLYFKSQKSRQSTLDSGICPNCFAEAKSFRDESTNTMFKVEAIEKRILKKHGCSGIVEIEYICNSCGTKAVHTTVGQSCSL
jgi:hypothetical protein